MYCPDTHNFLLHQQFAAVAAMIVGLCCSQLYADEEKDRQPPSVEQLISNLSSSDYELREQAAEELLSKGIEAEIALKKIRRTPDPQLRRQVQLLLTELEKVNRTQLLDNFVKNKDKNLRPPGWERFKKLYGDNEKTRKLYHSMAIKEWKLLELIDNNPTQVDYHFYKRALQLRNQSNQLQVHPSIGTLSTFLFIASDENLDISSPSFSELKYLLSSPHLAQELNKADEKSPLRNVVNSWILNCVDNSHLSQEHQLFVLLFAIRENLRSGVPLAKSLLEQPAPLVLTTRRNMHLVYSILAIAKLGSKEDIPFLENLLDDDEAVYSYTSNTSFETQVRDAALVAILHLSGKDPKKFGFVRLSTDPYFLYSYRTIGFSSIESREKVFSKYRNLKEE